MATICSVVGVSESVLAMKVAWGRVSVSLRGCQEGQIPYSCGILSPDSCSFTYSEVYKLRKLKLWYLTFAAHKCLSVSVSRGLPPQVV